MCIEVTYENALGIYESNSVQTNSDVLEPNSNQL